MNKDIKAQWIEALRSKKYKQGKNALRIPAPKGLQYCCMGVLADLYVQQFPDKARWDDLEGTDISYFMQEGYDYLESSLLPSSVVEWAQIPSSSGRYGNSDVSLVGMNDDGFSFSEIADVIEKEF